MFDIPPPENDKEANRLANNIRQWIKDGRAKPGEPSKAVDDEKDIPKQDKEEEPKKKGRFGFFRK